MKRKYAIISIALIFLLVPLIGAYADDPPIDMKSAQALLVAERSAGTVIINHNGDAKMEISGLSRLPALLVVCEEIDRGSFSLDTDVTVSQAASEVPGPTAFVAPYEVIDAASLMKAAAMICAGDAIYALAEAVYGSAGACLAALNIRLEELQIDASFSDIMGSDAALSANDLSALGVALMKSGTFTSMCSIYYDTITHTDGRETELASANKLLKNCTGCDGLATGSSTTAGYCGIFSVTRSDEAYICVILGAQNAADRFAAAQNAMEYTFATYETVSIARAGEAVAEADVFGGKESRVALTTRKDAALVGDRNTTYETTCEYSEVLTAPLHTDQPVGRIVCKDDTGSVLCEVELYPAADVEAATVTDTIRNVLVHWIHA